MSRYTSYPTVNDTPSRKQRKAKRHSIYWANRFKANEERKARRERNANTHGSSD